MIAVSKPPVQILQQTLHKSLSLEESLPHCNNKTLWVNTSEQTYVLLLPKTTLRDTDSNRGKTSQNSQQFSLELVRFSLFRPDIAQTASVQVSDSIKSLGVPQIQILTPNCQQALPYLVFAVKAKGHCELISTRFYCFSTNHITLKSSPILQSKIQAYSIGAQLQTGVVFPSMILKAQFDARDSKLYVVKTDHKLSVFDIASDLAEPEFCVSLVVPHQYKILDMLLGNSDTKNQPSSMYFLCKSENSPEKPQSLHLIKYSITKYMDGELQKFVYLGLLDLGISSNRICHGLHYLGKQQDGENLGLCYQDKFEIIRISKDKVYRDYVFMVDSTAADSRIRVLKHENILGKHKYTIVVGLKVYYFQYNKQPKRAHNDQIFIQNETPSIRVIRDIATDSRSKSLEWNKGYYSIEYVNGQLFSMRMSPSNMRIAKDTVDLLQTNLFKDSVNVFTKYMRFNNPEQAESLGMLTKDGWTLKTLMELCDKHKVSARLRERIKKLDQNNKQLYEKLASKKADNQQQRIRNSVQLLQKLGGPEDYAKTPKKIAKSSSHLLFS